MVKKKRKTDSTFDASERSVRQQRLTFTCVLHNSKGPHADPFTCFSSVKWEPSSEKLSNFLQIRKRRLVKPTDFVNHLKDACYLLQETLDGLDLETTGCHKRCYQDFTTHLYRLQNPSADASASQKSHSPHKKTSADAARVKFPPDECIFCEKNEIKVYGKTQRPTHSFVAWKLKESG